MRIPTHLQEIAESLALRSWVTSRDFPHATYYETIDLCTDRLAKSHLKAGEAEPSDVSIAIMIAGALNEEDLLTTHVISKGTYPISDDEGWHRICLAAAYAVMQAHERDCNSGKWLPK
jgi:hypothetical protein